MTGVESLTVIVCVTVLMSISLYLPFAAGDIVVLPIGTMGVAAYIYGYFAVHGAMPALAAVAGLSGAALIGVIVGVFILPFRGLGATLVTLAIVEIIGTFLSQFGPWGGALGLPGIPSLGPFAMYVAITLGIVVVLLITETGRAGNRLVAVRTDRMAAEACGIDTGVVRLRLVTEAAIVSGVAGVMIASFLSFISPSQFGIGTLNGYLAAPLIGGVTTVVGAVTGGVLTGAVPILINGLAQYEVIVFAVVVLLVLTLRPEGLVARRNLRGLSAPLRRLGLRRRPLPLRGVDVAKESSQGGTSVLVTSVTKRFGGVRAVSDVGFFVAPGEVVGIIGPNGAGKTTLVNLITAVQACDMGTITFDGVPLRRASLHAAVQHGIARTFQTPRVYDTLTVWENVALTGAKPAAIDETIGMMGLGSVAHTAVGNLSYGSRRRAEIARALVLRPRMLLLDEPTAGMTRLEARELAVVVRKIRETQVTMIIVEHNVRFLAELVDRLVVLDYGTLIADGSVEVVRADPNVRRAYFGEAVTQ
ncbi:MAG: branched-chain amino acid ABC transporter ATP-binding protein/permease [Candidatus Dormibacteria bacterium]